MTRAPPPAFPRIFNFYAEYITWNASLDEAQAGIKIAGRNINNLRYADDTTVMAESEEELKSLLMKMKEESETVGLKLNPQDPWPLSGTLGSSLRSPAAYTLFSSLVIIKWPSLKKKIYATVP